MDASQVTFRYTITEQTFVGHELIKNQPTTLGQLRQLAADKTQRGCSDARNQTLLEVQYYDQLRSCTEFNAREILNNEWILYSGGDLYFAAHKALEDNEKKLKESKMFYRALPWMVAATAFNLTILGIVHYTWSK